MPRKLWKRKSTFRIKFDFKYYKTWNTGIVQCKQVLFYLTKRIRRSKSRKSAQIASFDKKSNPYLVDQFRFQLSDLLIRTTQRIKSFQIRTYWSFSSPWSYSSMHLSTVGPGSRCTLHRTWNTMSTIRKKFYQFVRPVENDFREFKNDSIS